MAGLGERRCCRRRGRQRLDCRHAVNLRERSRAAKTPAPRREALSDQRPLVRDVSGCAESRERSAATSRHARAPRRGDGRCAARGSDHFHAFAFLVRTTLRSPRRGRRYLAHLPDLRRRHSTVSVSGRSRNIRAGSRIGPFRRSFRPSRHGSLLQRNRLPAHDVVRRPRIPAVSRPAAVRCRTGRG